MIKFNNKTISSVMKGNQTIGKIYKGSNLVFSTSLLPSLLPSEYQQVEYIENTEKQWINTRVCPTDNTIKLEVKIAYSTTTTGQLMGSGTSGSERFNFGIESKRFRFGFGGAWFDADSEVLTPDTEPHIWVLDANTKTCSIDGTGRTLVGTYNPSGSRVIALFARGSSSASVESGNRTKGKLYYAKIWDKGVLVRDYIPCYRKSDEEIGLYDLVEGRFYINEGTGKFLIGKPILPKEYQLVEYIENTSKQYIDTGVVGDRDCGVELKTYVTANINNGCGVGSWGENSGKTRAWLFYIFGATFRCGYGDTNTALDKPIELNAWYKWKIDIVNNQQIIYVNDENIYTSPPKDYFTTDQNLFIFGMNNRGSMSYELRSRMSYVKLYKLGKLVRDFVPCYRKEDGVIGMYDLVGNKFYINEGTGEFEKGNDI